MWAQTTIRGYILRYEGSHSVDRASLHPVSRGETGQGCERRCRIVNNPGLRSEDWPVLLYMLPHVARSVGLREELLELFAVWKSGVDVRPDVERLISGAMQKLSAGVAGPSLPNSDAAEVA